MTEFQRFIQKIAEQSGGTSWCGDAPSVRQEQIAAEIASKLGYPTSDFPIGEILLEVSLEEAARVMAYIANGSLAYGWRQPGRPSVIKDAIAALREMKPGARFFTNGDWGDPRIESPKGWTPLSKATFDAGVLGFDGETAFIVWTEDED
jgi:hypothetical protein